MPPRSVSVRTLRQECALLRTTVLQEGLADADSITAHVPGGNENPDKGPSGWLRFNQWLHRQHAKLEHRTSGTPNQAAADGVAMAVLRSEPERVALQVPIGDRDAVLVHPKSLRALTVIHALDLQLGFCGGWLDRLNGSDDPADLAVRLEAMDRVGLLLGRLAWIVATPGSGLPFDPVADPDSAPPAWVHDLDPVDLHAMAKAHRRVNALRLLALQEITTPDPTVPHGSGRWSTFAVSAASELGITDRELQETRDLPSVVAHLRIKGNAQREARQAAEAKSKSPRAGAL